MDKKRVRGGAHNRSNRLVRTRMLFVVESFEQLFDAVRKLEGRRDVA